MKIFVKRGNLWLDRREDGRRQRIPLHLPDTPAGRKQAREILRKEEEHRVLTRLGVSSGPSAIGPRIDAAAEQLAAEKRNAGVSEDSLLHLAYAVRDLVKLTEKAFLEQIERPDIVAFRDRMLAEGLAPNTVQRRLNLVKQLFDHHLLNNPDCSKPNPVRAVRVDAVPREASIMSEDELARFLGVLQGSDPIWLSIFYLQLYAGLRPAEINTLDWGSLDLKAGTARVRTAKRKPGEEVRYRTVALHPIVVEQLKKIPAQEREGKFLKKGMRWVRQKFEDKLVQAGIDRKNRDGKQPLRMHSLRHQFGTMFHALGRDVVLTQKTLGHSTSRVTSRYVHPEVQAQAEVIKKLKPVVPKEVKEWGRLTRFDKTRARHKAERKARRDAAKGIGTSNNEQAPEKRGHQAGTKDTRSKK